VPLPRLATTDGHKQIPRISVVAECLAEMHKQITVSGPEYETGPKLERILAQFMLPMTSSLGLCASLEIIPAKQVQQIARFQFCSLVSLPVGVYQQWKSDASLFPKQAGIIHIAHADRRQGGSGCVKLLLVLAQLRDMLAAEDSPIMPQEHNHRRAPLPECP